MNNDIALRLSSITFEKKYDTINTKEIIKILNDLKNVIFPGYFEPVCGGLNFYLEQKLASIRLSLASEITKVLKDDRNPIDIVSSFMEKIPTLKSMLLLDVKAIFDGDPASENYDEIIMCYPGLEAITSYRIAHELYLLKVPMIPRIITENAHSKTGIDIHPGATIGEYFFIDHGTGIVIGETTIIGKNVKIYQGVTIGALSLKEGHSLNGVKRHPTIMDNVTIYAGASILGGNTVIGIGCTIGSNVFITKSVDDGKTVTLKTIETK